MTAARPTSIISRCLGKFAAALCLCALLAFDATAQPVTTRAGAKASCQSLRDDASKINDYRLRDTTAFMRFSVEDNWKAHTKPAIDRIRAGDFSQPAIADLDFTLRGWPNHPFALGAIVDYAVGGGKSYGFPPVECYFAHAQRWFPKDPTVYMLEGQYYWKRKNLRDALLAYQDALALDDSLIEVHYNLGLVYFELKQLDKARQHARTAYSGGYPLPGLRKKLIDAGAWVESSGNSRIDGTEAGSGKFDQ